MDNFNYAYYSNTNKLQRVTGSGTQYTYDENGNMITDEVNRNRDIKFDYRNLITQIRNKKIVIEDSLVYVTYYFYDEAGNRIRKNVYQYIGIQPSDSVETPDIGDIGDMTGYWDLIKDEVYSRDVSGKEVALYVNGNLMQNNIWGLGNEGYITSAGALNFYLKGHLGSVRAVIDENNSVISSQDYDAWGYLLQGREYHSDGSVYKFTGKERDAESEYDYSYARNYNSRIGLFNSSEPIPSSSFGWGSYVYCGDNPLKIIDPSGEDWFYIYDEEGGGTWEYDEVEGKNVWTGRYDENKNKIMEWKQGYEELLFFQGNQLQWLQENGNIEYWYAVSGELDKYKQTNPLFEHVPEKGPIPQGWWTVDPQNAYSIDKSQGIIDYLKWKYYRKGPFGEAYINISPAPDNPTNRREGFSIHGGDEPGSIGCIDLTSGMNDFYNKFVIHNKSMLLNVDYSKFTP